MRFRIIPRVPSVKLPNRVFSYLSFSLVLSASLANGLVFSSQVQAVSPSTSPLKKVDKTQIWAQTNASNITIKAVGDTILGSNFPKNELPSDPATLFAKIQPYLQGSDLLFGNFESTLTNFPRSAKRPNGKSVFAFRSPPEYAATLKDAGFDVLSVANNHAFDFTEVGFADTFENIAKSGIKPVGKKGQILYLNIKGTSVAFIGFSHTRGHNSVNDLTAGKALVREANEKAQVVVISVHMGAEGSKALRVRNKAEIFYRENRGNPVLFSRTMIDSGADLILGHGPHVPRAMELYKGKLIAYSLGNFLGYKTLSTKGEKGLSLVLETELDSQGNFVRGKILPARLDKEGIPYPDAEKRSIKFIQAASDRDFPNNSLQISADGEISRETAP
jgi:poly-gamma-glutamate capsule biosynthesis protein CapA/YwtB (metallophosphatase superfamily)